MKTIAVITAVLLIAPLTNAPVSAWQVDVQEHAQRHPEEQGDKTKPVPPPTPRGMDGMKAMKMTESDAQLEELVKKMNAARGQAKVDAIAELLTALVRTHRTVHADMDQMMSKMRGGHDGAGAR
jgi:hypothetical protein